MALQLVEFWSRKLRHKPCNGGVTMGQELAKRKSAHTCVGCGKPIFVPVITERDGGPIVAVSNGFMHWDCRQKQHSDNLALEEQHRTEVHRRRSEAGKKAAAKLYPAKESLFAVAERMGRKARGENKQ